MTILRWVGRALLVLVGIAVLAIGAVYAQSERLLARTAAAPARKAPAVSADSATLARGRTLMAASGCQGCDSYRKLSDDEIAGLYLYLKTIPAKATVTRS